GLLGLGPTSGTNIAAKVQAAMIPGHASRDRVRDPGPRRVAEFVRNDARADHHFRGDSGWRREPADRLHRRSGSRGAEAESGAPSHLRLRLVASSAPAEEGTTAARVEHDAAHEARNEYHRGAGSAPRPSGPIRLHSSAV